ncbi:FadR/GntR family transcriptional regulator [Sphingomonas sp. KR1UV-12]|uniref:FadR/GntR family transcriptional regulator n=1 Tax=Sphingomonas aurea TaxID=3063994 RepID=A0ABT9EJK9_9SPHN|nr:FadR/GntR family transcriptional regulator [Sphingomonas sp. KR1UV-12]MDP1026828.1 FadR/GntR family transcriptional regulator [Sphingomonas sp. KR1UV-12]
MIAGPKVTEMSMVGRRVRGSLLQSLGRSILSGEFRPGELLPGEVSHAADLAVSRGVYREAVQALIAKGLVESRPKTGTRVLPRQRWNMLDPEVLAWAFAGTPDMRLLRSLFELREAIEPFAACLAAERRSDEDLAAMDQALIDMDRLTLATEEGQAADRRFHEMILTASDNDALTALGSGIAAGVEWSTRFKQRKRALPRDPVPEHRLVYDAIAASDPELARARMQMLVRNALADTWFGMGGTVGR